MESLRFLLPFVAAMIATTYAAKLRTDLFTSGYLKGGKPQVKAGKQSSAVNCLNACNDLRGKYKDINSVDFHLKNGNCYCNRGAYIVRASSSYNNSFIIPVDVDKIQENKWTEGAYTSGGSQFYLGKLPSANECLEACYTRRLSGISSINGVDYGVGNRDKRCYCNKKSNKLVKSKSWKTSAFVKEAIPPPPPPPTAAPPTAAPETAPPMSCGAVKQRDGGCPKYYSAGLRLGDPIKGPLSYCAKQCQAITECAGFVLEKNALPPKCYLAKKGCGSEGGNKEKFAYYKMFPCSGNGGGGPAPPGGAIP